MKKITFLISIITFLIIGTTPILALTSTSSATTPTPDDKEVNENLQDRIRTMVQQNVSTTEAKLKEKINQLSLVGYVGKVTAVTASSISMDTENETLQVATTDTTNIVSAGKNIKISAIAIGDKIIVIGTLNTKKDIISSKRIVVIKEVVADKPTVFAGIVQSVDVKKKTIIIKTLTDQQTLVLSKKANLKIEEVTVGKSILVITRPQDVGMVITKIKIL